MMKAGDVRYTVTGYFTPSGIQDFATEEEAMAAKNELLKDSWHSLVTVIKHETLYVEER